MSGSPFQDIALGSLRSLAEEIEQQDPAIGIPDADGWLEVLFYFSFSMAGFFGFFCGLYFLIMCCKCACVKCKSRLPYDTSRVKELQDLSIVLLWRFAPTLLFSGLSAIFYRLAITDSLNGYTYFGPMRVLDGAVLSKRYCPDSRCYTKHSGKLHVGWGMSWGCPETPTTWCESFAPIPECTYIEQEGNARFGYADDAIDCVRSLARIPYFEDAVNWSPSAEYNSELPPDEDPNWPYYDFYGDCSSCSALDAVEYEYYVHKAEKLRVSGITLTVAGAALYVSLALAFAFYRREASQLVEDLSELLGDDPWKELIRVQGWTRCARADYPRFHGLVADVMSSLWREWGSRRRVNKDEQLRKAADEILRRFKLVRASKIVDAEFLEDSDDPFDKTIRAYCLEHCNMRMLLLGFSIRSTDMRHFLGLDARQYSEYKTRRLLTKMPARPHDEVKRVLGLVEEGRVLEAMHELVPWFGDAVAPDIAATVVVDCERFRSYATALALTLWKSKFVDDLASEQPCARDVYSACLEEFPALFESFLILMQDSRVNKFVSRAKRCDYIVSWVCDNRVALKALQEKRYEDIVLDVSMRASG